MKVLGIIAEFNPFHSGHAYLIRQCRKISECDYVVAVMSGQFTQRGEPAVVDKFTRAQMALSCGVDAVIELPSLMASAGAAYFADCGISLLAHTGLVTDLGFGSECGDLEVLKHISGCLNRENEHFKMSLQQALKEGCSFPAARQKALSGSLDADLLPYIASPNNILGIEYLSSLSKRQSTIRPLTINRQGSGYHDASIQQQFCSASALRKITLEQGADLTADAIYMPPAALEIYRAQLQKTPAICLDDFSLMLRYALLNADAHISYFDVPADLYRRMSKLLPEFTTTSDFIERLKTKNYTYTTIARALLHLLLGQTNDDLETMESLDKAPYLRILGFKTSAAPLLKALKQSAGIPIITKPADALKKLNPAQMKVFEQSLHAERVYQMVAEAKSGCRLPDDLQRTPVML